jgi:hypothetical protein
LKCYNENVVNKKQNFEAVGKPKSKTSGIGAKNRFRPNRRLVLVDSVYGQKRQPARPAVTVSLSPAFVVPFHTTGAQKGKFGLASLYAKMPQAVPLILALALAFTGGMWYALMTPESAAQVQQPVPQVESASITAPIPLANVPAQPSPAVSNDVLFNTPIQMLKDYLDTAAAQGHLQARKARLHEFLKSRNSPLEPQADLIAEQNHWKLILAISFAESTLGEKCFDFNCSGIGGSQIRSYKSFDNWILDFNRLLEKRYKDKTLEQMCGVYVQPCNPNWLLATGQILTALDEAKIE